MGCGGSVDASWRKAAAALKSTAPMARTHCGRLPISPGLIAAFGGPEGVTIRSGERLYSHNGYSWRNTNEPKRLLVPHLIDAKPIDLNQNLWTKTGEFYASEWVELDLGEELVTLLRWRAMALADPPLLSPGNRPRGRVCGSCSNRVAHATVKRLIRY